MLCRIASVVKEPAFACLTGGALGHVYLSTVQENSFECKWKKFDVKK